MEVVIPTIGTISQCAKDPSYQLAIQTEGMVKDIVKHLSADVSLKLSSYFDKKVLHYYIKLFYYEFNCIIKTFYKKKLKLSNEV